MKEENKEAIHRKEATNHTPGEGSWKIKGIEHVKAIVLQVARTEPNVPTLVKWCNARIQGRVEEDRSDPDIVSPQLSGLLFHKS